MSILDTDYLESNEFDEYIDIFIDLEWMKQSVFYSSVNVAGRGGIFLHNKLIQYTEEERNWMDSEGITYTPLEMAPYLTFNPCVDVKYWKELVDGLCREKYETPIYVIVRNDIIIPEYLHKKYPGIKIVTQEQFNKVFRGNYTKDN